MVAIGDTCLGHRRIRPQVVVPVGQAQSRLAEFQHVCIRITVILGDDDLEWYGDTFTRGLCGQARVVFTRGDGVDAIQPGTGRRQALGVEGRLVEEGGVGSAGLAVRIFPRCVEDALDALAIEVVEAREHSVVGFVRGNGCGARPCAIGIAIEVRSRRHRAVHPRDVEAERPDLRLPARLRRNRRCRAGHEQRSENDGVDFRHAGLRVQPLDGYRALAKAIGKAGPA